MNPRAHRARTFQGAQPKVTMTTSVRVSAHCPPEKQVRIIRSSLEDVTGTTTILQDGETNEQVVYDGWNISVEEEMKPPQA